MGALFGYSIGLTLTVILCALYYRERKAKAETYEGRTQARVTEKGYTNRDCYLRFVYYVGKDKYDGVAVVSAYRYDAIHTGDTFGIQFDMEDPSNYYVDDRNIAA